MKIANKQNEKIKLLDVIYSPGKMFVNKRWTLCRYVINFDKFDRRKGYSFARAIYLFTFSAPVKFNVFICDA